MEDMWRDTGERKLKQDWERRKEGLGRGKGMKRRRKKSWEKGGGEDRNGGRDQHRSTKRPKHRHSSNAIFKFGKDTTILDE